ncbi:BatA domain-containing protein [Tenacibaculum aestuariivivum]|uniref:BatA domain-containing protein n=1 Tax=Tenacibaculum aestuariivivum TaxID=2006131 RepID=UPI003AB1AB07
MLFKHPEILYFLALLLIPILIHLFQLQRFVKVPFTNVAFLKKLALQTRKSSRIKKWLILATRLLLLTFLIIAFAQPYFSNRKNNEQQHFLIYLDNSLSTNTKGEKGNLLQVAIQEIIENTAEEINYSILTNDGYYKNKTALELKNILLNVKNTAKNSNLKTVSLKIASENKINSFAKNIIISDFQNTTIKDINKIPSNSTLVKLNAELQSNLSIDSVYVSNNGTTYFDIHVLVKNQGLQKKEVPIAIYNGDKLVNKQVFSVDKNEIETITFSVIKTDIFSGKIKIDYNDTYNFDNSFYFAINSNSKIAVLNISETADFFNRIYTKDEFELTTSTVQNLNYNLIEKQHLIVLNEIKKLPKTLITSLIEYSNKGGNIVVIPAENINILTYNNFFYQLKIGQLLAQKNDSLKITTINYKNPLLKNVFEKEVLNFQYPFAKTSYTTAFKNTSDIINFENKQAFIQQINTKKATIYWVAAPLNKKNSNFINAPLIVPVFYNIGKQSLQLPKLYYTVGKKTTIDIDNKLNKEEVLTISNNKMSFIPLQQILQNNIKITTSNQPLEAGFYQIKQAETNLKKIAFNYPKKESLLNFLDTETAETKLISNSVKNTLQNSNNENKIQWLWKWFLALAIVSLLTEILILKFFKP